jgi:hypothetical protein
MVLTVTRFLLTLLGASLFLFGLAWVLLRTCDGSYEHADWLFSILGANLFLLTVPLRHPPRRAARRPAPSPSVS